MSSTLGPVVLAVAVLALFGPCLIVLGARPERWRELRGWAWFLPLIFAAAPAAGLSSDWYGLDFSWRVALTWASERGLSHGRDVLYTYGPLHFLSTRLPPAGWGWTLLVLDLALWTGTVYAARAALRSHPAPRVLAVLLALIWLAAGPLLQGHDLAFSALWLGWAFALLAIRDEQAWPAVVAVAIAVVLTFVKLNTGLFALALTLPAVVAASLLRRRHASAAGLVVIAVVLLGGLTWALRVAPVDYVRLGWAQMQGYVDTMSQSITASGQVGWFAVAITIAAMAVVALAYGVIAGGQGVTPAAVASWGLMLTGLFLTFKQGFTRADAGHVGVFMRVMPLFLWLGAAFGGPTARAGTLALACAMPLLALHETRLRPQGIVDQAQRVAAYVRAVPTLVAGRADDRMWPVLPPSLREALSSERVDVLPTEAALLREIPHAWSPRPAFQDIVSVTPEIDDMNARTYASPNGPTRLLVQSTPCPTDGCALAEGRVHLAVQQGFMQVASGRDYRLLVRRSQPLAHREAAFELGRVPLGTTIRLPEVPADTWHLVATPAYSRAGRLSRLLLQPPVLALDQFDADGEPVASTVASPSRLPGGVPLDPAARSIALRTVNPWGFEPDVPVRLVAHVFSDAGAIPDGLPVWGRYDWPASPAVVPPTDGCAAGVVDRIWVDATGQWLAEGWAVLPETPADGVMAWDGDERIGEALTMGVRDDVREALGAGRGLLSGFRMRLRREPSGTARFSALDAATGGETALCVTRTN